MQWMRRSRCAFSRIKLRLCVIYALPHPSGASCYVTGRIRFFDNGVNLGRWRARYSGVGRYSMTGVDGQGVVAAVDRNILVELVLKDVADVGTSDAESRSSGRSMSAHTIIVSLASTHMKSE